MILKDLQSYNFVSIHAYCCTESIKMTKCFPSLFPGHHVKIIGDPIRRINFAQKIKMGEIEGRIHKVIETIKQGIVEHKKYCVNCVPLLDIMWIQLYKKVSPYLVKEAIELFKRIDMVVIPCREEVLNRRGDQSWFTKSGSKAKELEDKISTDLADLAYENNIDYISLNKLLEIAQAQNLWG